MCRGYFLPGQKQVTYQARAIDSPLAASPLPPSSGFALLAEDAKFCFIAVRALDKFAFGRSAFCRYGMGIRMAEKPDPLPITGPSDPDGKESKWPSMESSK
jgi:hypothetical protein